MITPAIPNLKLVNGKNEDFETIQPLLTGQLLAKQAS